MFRKFAAIVLIIRWPLLLAMILITGILGYSAVHLKIDPTVETLFVKNTPEFRFYQKYRNTYGSDQLVLVAMATPDLFTDRNLQKLKFLTGLIGSFDEVERVLSLANVKDMKPKFLGVKLIPALRDVYDGERKPEEIREEILKNELYTHNLVSADGKIGTLLIQLKPSLQGRSASGRFIKDLRELLAREKVPGTQYYIAGAPVEQYEFVNLIRRDQFTFVPMISFLLLLTTFLIYQSLSCTILAMSIVFATLVWSMGTIAVLGVELNLVTSLLAPVIMIISVVNGIHLMNLFFEIRRHHTSLRLAVLLTLEQLGPPCFLTHFTTVLGFASLAFNPVPAIQSFGIFAALGTCYSFVVAMLLVPILLPVLPYRNREGSEESHFFNRVLVGFLERLEYRWKWVILLISVLVVAGSVVGIQRLEVDTNIVKQLKPDSDLAISTRFIDENLTGVYTLGFVLKRKDGQTLMRHDSLKQMDEFKEALEKIPAITKVNSITTLIKKIHLARKGESEGYRIPLEDSTLNRYAKGLRKKGGAQVWSLISRDFKEARIEARMKAVGTKEGYQVEMTARQYMREILEKDFEVHLTGNVVLLGNMAKNLVYYQIKSFAFAFLSILALITLIFRSVRLGLLAAIPNLLPILAIYGMMGFLGIELSTATAMISSIVLGLVVDSSIHFLHRFRLEFKQRHHYLQALHHTYRNVGQAMVVSTLILVVGFASSVFTGFRPTANFGILTSLTIFFALIFTLLALPVCLILVKPFGPQRLFKR